MPAPVGTRVLGIGKGLPEGILTNHDLEQRVDTTDEWIRTRTGIVERRIAPPEIAASDLAAEAGRQALADAGIGPEEVDLLVVATGTPDTMFPSTACWVQAHLSLRRIPAFDVSAACSGFLYGWIVADHLVRAGAGARALVIGVDVLSRVTNWEDRDTCVLLGDGAGAAVVTAGDGRSGLLAGTWGADGRLARLLYQPAGGSRMPASEETVRQRLHTLRMNGREVFRHAVTRMHEALLEVLREAEVDPEEIDLLVPHQANLRIMQAVADRAGVPREKVLVTVDRYGNNSAASIPVALAEAREQGRLRRGDLVAAVAFGSGFTWAATLFRW